MGAKDRWDINITCPQCNATGNGSVYQYDGFEFENDPGTYVSSLSDGFRSESQPGKGKSDKIFCKKCGEFVK